jgi:hypothetical protein
MYKPSSHMVKSVALLDMPPVDAAIYYPAGGVGDGWGIASGWGLRGLTDVVESLGPLHVTADAGMFRPFAECPVRAHQVMSQPPSAGVSEIAFLAMGDAMDGTAGVPEGVPAYVVLAHHGGLINQVSVQAGIRDLLSGRPIASDVTRLNLVNALSAMSNAWHAPGLLPGTGPPRDC